VEEVGGDVIENAERRDGVQGFVRKVKEEEEEEEEDVVDSGERAKEETVIPDSDEEKRIRQCDSTHEPVDTDSDVGLALAGKGILQKGGDDDQGSRPEMEVPRKKRRLKLARDKGGS
jgi:hypothetical protein